LDRAGLGQRCARGGLVGWGGEGLAYRKTMVSASLANSMEVPYD